jgi:hypothetical protein
MGVGALFLIFTVGASAATVNGTATIETATDGTMTYPAASTTEFTVLLPTGAACSGDTASDGYHVYSYMVAQGSESDIPSLTFVSHPSAGYGFYNNSGAYQGPFNTAPTTGEVTTLPLNFEWGPAVAAAKIPLATLLAGNGEWETGIACANSSNALTDNWNTQITFTASSTDPNGFVWSAVPGGLSSTSTPTTTSSPTTTTASTTAATTSSGGTTSTTAASGTSTTSGANGTSGGSSSGSSGTDGATGDGSGTTTGSLAFTGMPAPVTKIVGAGFLGIGLGLMLLGSAGRRRLGVLREVRSGPR